MTERSFISASCLLTLHHYSCLGQTSTESQWWVRGGRFLLSLRPAVESRYFASCAWTCWMCLEQFLPSGEDLVPLYCFARLCSVFFSPQLGLVRKQKTSLKSSLFFPPSFLLFHLLGVGWWCSVSRGLRAVAVPLYVPPSLCSLLVPRCGCWHRFFFFFFFSFLFSFVLLLASCGLVLGELPPQSFPSTELVSSSGCCPARMPLAALRPSARQEKPRVNTRIVWRNEVFGANYQSVLFFFHTRKILADFTRVWILSGKAEQTHLQPGDVIFFFLIWACLVVGDENALLGRNWGWELSQATAELHPEGFGILSLISDFFFFSCWLDAAVMS